MLSVQQLKSKKKISRRNLWLEKLLAIIAFANFILVIFDLSYIPWRDFYFTEAPTIVRYYDQVKGIEPHRSGGMKVTSLEPQELEIRTLNNAAVAIAKIFLTGIFQGEFFSGNFRYTRVWHHTDKGWRIIAGHCSAIP